jgi:Tol biopolymer transport system component
MDSHHVPTSWKHTLRGFAVAILKLSRTSCVDHSVPRAAAMTRPPGLIAGTLLAVLLLGAQLSCSDSTSSPTEGGIHVTVVSSGAPPDPDGYGVSVDGGPAQAVAANGSVTASSLAPGSHSVALISLATQCSVVGENPRTVEVSRDSTTEVEFEVTCTTGTGAIEVTTTTDGEDLDPDGYTVSLDGGAAQPILGSGTLTLSELETGEHALELSDVAPNCAVAGGTSLTTTVTGGQTATVTFAITCSAIPDISGRVLFTSGVGAGADIFVTNPDGSPPTNLTHNPAFDDDASWSPDGSRIAFVSTRDGDREIYVMEADGSNVTRTTNSPGDDLQPAWSPDGTRIAFSSARDGNYEIYTMNPDGSDPVRVTDEPGEDSGVSWSPDGARLVFHSERAGLLDLIVANSDGTGEPLNITNHPAEDSWPDWSPDGTAIVFVSSRDGFPYELYTVSPDGGGVTRVSDNDVDDFRPSWSPDGDRIAVERGNLSASGNTDIVVIEADGTGELNLTNSPAHDTSADWGP